MPTVYALALGRGLVGRGHDVRLLAADGSLSSLLAADTLKRTPHALTGSWWRDLFEPQRIERALGSFRPDIVHVTDEALDLAGHNLSRRWEVPRLLTSHGRRAGKWSWRRPDVLLAPAQGQRATAVNLGGLTADRVRVVPYGLPEVPKPESTPLAGDRRPSVGAVGPLRRGRGLKQFVRAMRLVGSKRPDALFPVLGSGPYHPFLSRHAEALGLSDRVIIAESCVEPRVAIGALDVVVFPSTDEEFGCLATLAMALGRPVVASAVGQAFDLITDGETGLLVAPGDEQGLARRVSELLADPGRARAGERRARRCDQASSAQRDGRRDRRSLRRGHRRRGLGRAHLTRRFNS